MSFNSVQRDASEVIITYRINILQTKSKFILKALFASLVYCRKPSSTVLHRVQEAIYTICIRGNTWGLLSSSHGWTLRRPGGHYRCLHSTHGRRSSTCSNAEAHKHPITFMMTKKRKGLDISWWLCKFPFFVSFLLPLCVCGENCVLVKPLLFLLECQIYVPR